MSFLCGCGEKTITNDDYENALKNIEYNNFKIMILPALSSSVFYFDLNGIKYDFTTHEKKDDSFEAFIDNIDSNDKVSILATINAFNVYDDTSIMFYENGYIYQEESFEYVVDAEREYAIFSDQAGSCKYIVKNSKDNPLESTCNKTQENSVKPKIDEFNKKLKSWGTTNKELKGLSNYIMNNYFDSLVTQLNDSYLNYPVDSIFTNSYIDKANTNGYLHVMDDNGSYLFADSTYTNAFAFYYRDNEIYAGSYYNADLTGENGYLISIDNGKTYHYTTTQDGNGCVVSIPFNTVIYKKTGTESSDCTDTDFSNIDLLITAKNKFISSLSYGALYPPITEKALQRYVESKIK